MMDDGCPMPYGPSRMASALRACAAVGTEQEQICVTHAVIGRLALVFRTLEQICAAVKNRNGTQKWNKK